MIDYAGWDALTEEWCGRLRVKRPINSAAECGNLLTQTAINRRDGDMVVMKWVLIKAAGDRK